MTDGGAQSPHLVEDAVPDRDVLVLVQLLRSDLVVVHASIDAPPGAVRQGAARGDGVVEVLDAHEGGLLACKERWVYLQYCSLLKCVCVMLSM